MKSQTEEYEQQFRDMEKCTTYSQLLALIGPDILSEIIRSYTIYEDLSALERIMRFKAIKRIWSYSIEFDRLMLENVKGALELSIIEAEKKRMRA